MASLPLCYFLQTFVLTVATAVQLNQGALSLSQLHFTLWPCSPGPDSPRHAFSCLQAIVHTTSAQHTLPCSLPPTVAPFFLVNSCLPILMQLKYCVWAAGLTLSKQGESFLLSACISLPLISCWLDCFPLSGKRLHCCTLCAQSLAYCRDSISVNWNRWTFCQVLCWAQGVSDLQSASCQKAYLKTQLTMLLLSLKACITGTGETRVACEKPLRGQAVWTSSSPVYSEPFTQDFTAVLIPLA